MRGKMLLLIIIMLLSLFPLCNKISIVSSQEESWSAIISVTSEYGGSDLTFGVDPSATDGFDNGLDEPAPPPPPSPYVIAYFYYPENPEYYKKLITSIIPPKDQMVWPIRVEFYPTSTPATVYVNISISDIELAKIPSKYTVFIYDNETGEWINLSEQKLYRFPITVNPPFPMWYRDLTLIVKVETDPPVIYNLNPLPNSYVNTSTPIISANYIDYGVGVDPNSVRVYVNDVNVTSEAIINETGFTYIPSTPLPEGTVNVNVTVADLNGNVNSTSWQFIIDVTSPSIYNLNPPPNSIIANTKPTISASYSDNYGIDTSKVKLYVNGIDVTSNSTITDSEITYTPTEPLPEGLIQVLLIVADYAGNVNSTLWNFTIFDPYNWSIKITITSEYGGADLEFGVNPYASLGYDEYDEPAPPPPPAPYVMPYFYYPENPEMYTKLIKSIVPPLTSVEFPIKVDFMPTSTPATVTVNVTWDSNEVASKTIIYAYVQLVDEETGTIIDMKEENHYSFTITVNPPWPMWYRDLKIVLGNDTMPPTVYNLQPGNQSYINNPLPIIAANFTDDCSGVNASSVRIFVNDTEVTDEAIITVNGFTYIPSSPFNEGTVTVRVIVADNLGKLSDVKWSFTIDLTPPTIYALTPENKTYTLNMLPIISANYTDNLSGINITSIKLLLNGTDITLNSTVTPSKITYTPTEPLGLGVFMVELTVTDNAGNIAHAKWYFMICIKVTLELHKGWNLISLPVKPLTTDPSEIFGDIGTFYIYGWTPGLGYSSVDEVKVGYGYWILVMNDVNVTIYGLPMDEVYVKVKPGWNLLGSITYADAQIEAPPGTVSSYLFIFKNNMYMSVDAIPSGYGAWTLAFAECTAKLKPLPPQPPQP